MRRRIVAGNWKMYTDLASATSLAEMIREGSNRSSNVDVLLCPPTPFLLPVGELLEGSGIALGAQNLYYKKEGAFTGEVAPQMLRSVGCTYAIVGHSERRTIFGESDYDVKMKANAAIDHKLHPIICVGETEGEREEEMTYKVLNRQVREAFDGIFKEEATSCVVAYEPVWAIGTGKTATPEIAQEAHRFIRELLVSKYDQATADNISILYGGSVKPTNARELFAQPDIDGGLIGGASLNAQDFLTIIDAA
ncbi:MAG: triose-phosphate isomerase [Candidatus Kapaibacterium sp.]